jgi:hypothetical protein
MRAALFARRALARSGSLNRRSFNFLMAFHVGTSGWSYDHWKGIQVRAFYYGSCKSARTFLGNDD